MSKRPRWRKKRWLVPALVLLAITAIGLLAWANRISIANDFIADQLAANDLPATYIVERVGGNTQIISDLIIGNPEAPDFTAERVIVRLRHRFGLPQVGTITLVKPRLFGRYVDGQLSFGSLDNVLFTDSGEPASLPDIDIAIRDGRGLIETDYGPVGLKIAGEGNVANDFSGTLAMSAPELSVGGCKSEDATLYGRITTSGGTPNFNGPVRMAALGCEGNGFATNDLVVEMDLTANQALSDPEFEARIISDQTRFAGNNAQSLAGTLRAQVRGEAMTSRYSVALRGVKTSQVVAALLTAEGTFRAKRKFTTLDVEADIEGNGLRMGQSLVASIERLAKSSDGTLLEPIARSIGSSIEAQTRGSSLEAGVRFRIDENGFVASSPNGELRGGGGARIASFSRLEYSSRDGRPPQISGNVATGGPGIPRISGRMERNSNGDAIFRMSMAPYEARGSRLAIPSLSLAQAAGGAMKFRGEVQATGPVPGGMVDRLALPIDGRWTSTGDLALWNDCTRIAFRRMAIAELNIAGPDVTLCPPPGKPMLRYGRTGLKFAAGATALNLKGSLGETPVRLTSGPIGLAYPGVLQARDLDISLGPVATASRFAISDLDARLGENIAGTFGDAEIALASVPLTLVNTSGDWDYTDGRVTIGGAEFHLIDRNEPDRFEPLIARDAGLTLIDNIIDATAELRNPATDRIVTRADIRHDLSAGVGHANLAIAGLQFDEKLQPVDISRLALGVVANADGIITGRGRIDWSPDTDVSSTGSFSSNNLDFAAAFGPVKGASGTVEFTDLLNLTTAPNQKIRVASVNPGIEVLEGEVQFSLENGEVLTVSGGRWPFMGGTLILREVDLNLGISEERRYVFEIVGLDAAEFIAQMDLGNISATGIFDGTIPIVFDIDGNGRIEEGILVSRAPGGNVSYVGELTYEDLSAIANYAFDALRSLDYSQMRIVMNGPLTGEIVTQVRFDGVRQGEGAKTNFVTKQLAKLPIQFRINIRAQFYQLITSIKSMYDPSSVRDPRELGLLSDDGTRLLRRSITAEEAGPETNPEDLIPSIQDEESE